NCNTLGISELPNRIGFTLIQGMEAIYVVQYLPLLKKGHESFLPCRIAHRPRIHHAPWTQYEGTPNFASDPKSDITGIHPNPVQMDDVGLKLQNRFKHIRRVAISLGATNREGAGLHRPPVRTGVGIRFAHREN